MQEAESVPINRHSVPPVSKAPMMMVRHQASPVAETVYERFRRQHPLTFDGSMDPVIAEDWVDKLQRIFDFMRLSDEERVACAVHQLEKNARYWWNLVVQTENMATLS